MKKNLSKICYLIVVPIVILSGISGALLYAKTGSWPLLLLLCGLLPAVFFFLAVWVDHREEKRAAQAYLLRLSKTYGYEDTEIPTPDQILTDVEQAILHLREEAFQTSEQRMRFVLNWAGKCDKIVEDLEQILASLEAQSHPLSVDLEREKLALHGMLQQLKAYFRSALSDRAYDIEQVELSKVISDTVLRNGPLFNQKSIGFRRNTVKMYVQSDPHLLGMALDELLDNALRHSAPSTYIGLWCREDDENIRISIEDSGDGIPAEDAVHIFEKGFTGRNEQSPTTGMGLFLARSYVEQLGHTLTVEPRNGGGTRAIITLRKTPSRHS